MAFYCELPNERICDIGWERLTCTEQWLEDQIREIQGYSREQRVRLGKECVNDVIRFLANMYKNDEAGTDSYHCRAGKASKKCGTDNFGTGGVETG